MTLSGNQLFPSDNPWNDKITNAPVAANSATLVASIGAATHLHADFGTTYNGALNGIPYNVVSGTQPKVNVVIDAYPGESDLLSVPIPAAAVIEGDPLSAAQNTSDRHLLVYDQDNNIAYELFNVHRPAEEADGQWHADSEAVWQMSKDSFRTPGFTSADAAGLPILPGLVRSDEVQTQGAINHALRFTVPKSDNAYVFPASHEAGMNNSAEPRMGERFRLKASFNIAGFSAANQVILQALKDYGMIVADNGSAWYLSGAPSPSWNDSDLHALTQVVGSNFEAVDLTPIVSGLDQTSANTAGGTAVTIHGLDFAGTAGRLQVFFGATAAANVTVVSDTEVMATAPAHAAGNVDVSVTSPYGTSAIVTADQFRFTTSAWQNPLQPLDVNADGIVDPLDALVVINQLNAGGPGPLPNPTANEPPPFLDVNGDGLLAPLDALIIINALNNKSSAAASPLGLAFAISSAIGSSTVNQSLSILTSPAAASLAARDSTAHPEVVTGVAAAKPTSTIRDRRAVADSFAAPIADMREDDLWAVARRPFDG